MQNSHGPREGGKSANVSHGVAVVIMTARGGLMSPFRISLKAFPYIRWRWL